MHAHRIPYEPDSILGKQAQQPLGIQAKNAFKSRTLKLRLLLIHVHRLATNAGLNQVFLEFSWTLRTTFSYSVPFHLARRIVRTYLDGPGASEDLGLGDFRLLAAGGQMC